MIQWLVQSIVDHPDLAAGRPPAGLLSRAEQARYAGYLNPKRRRDWLLGRWTAKQLIQAHIAATGGFCPPLSSFTVTQEPDGAPYVVSLEPALVGSRVATGDDGRMPLVVSISHSHGYALCAICDAGAPPPQLGADIELVEPREPAFIHDYFTEQERALLAGAPGSLTDLLVTALWSAKESVLKALRLGLRVDTRLVQCAIQPDAPDTWTPFRVELCGMLAQPAAVGTNGTRQTGLHGWWRVAGNRLRPGTQFVLTLVTQDCSL